MMNPVIQAILIGLPATVLGVLAYLRSRKVDAVTEQSGVATETRAGTGQIIQGLNDLVENLQEDNRVSREDIRYLREQVAALHLELNGLKKEVAELEGLKREVARMRRKYSDDENQ